MEKFTSRSRFLCSGMVLLIVMLLCSSAWAASISGTVSDASGKSGRIYLKVHWSDGGDTGIGVSIPAAGDFTIDGVQPNNSYIVTAFMDTQSTNVQHANDPSGASSPVNVSASTGSAGTIILDNPLTVPAQAPDFFVFRGTGGNAVMWDGPQTNDGLVIADKYTVSWSTSPTGLPLAGSRDVVAGYNDFFIHNNGATNLYYQVTAVAGGTSSDPLLPWIAVPAASGAGSVTGKVYFPGAAPTGPLIVILYDDSTFPPRVNLTAIASPISGGTYTISNVPAGNYQVVAFVDQNNNGAFDLGDIGWLDDDDFNPRVTVSSAVVTAADLTLNNVDASIVLYTQHGKNKSGEWYNLDLTVQSMKKRVVNVELVSGPQLSSAVDVALDSYQEFNAWVYAPARPTVGDSYQIKVTYADGTMETVYKAVTGVLDGLPIAVAPVSNVAYNPTPTFSWSAPSPAPLSEYVYSLWMDENNGNWMWDVWAIPSSTTSLVYASQGDFNQDTLTNGTTYNWTIQVKDRNRNEAQNQVTFTPTTQPAINSFTPAWSALPTPVTITGVNFSPNPASNFVRFNGVTAPVTSATSTTLTVIVPGGATTGKIQVATAQVLKHQDITIGAPATVHGMIKTTAGVAVVGARVEKNDDSSVFTTTAADGSFTLNWIHQTIAFKITKIDYVPTYTVEYWIGGNKDSPSISVPSLYTGRVDHLGCKFR